MTSLGYNNESTDQPMPIFNVSALEFYTERVHLIDPAYTLSVGITVAPIIILGVLGNVCSLLVWIKGRRRKSSTARYLSALAIADIVVLVTSALDFWVAYTLHFNLRTSSGFLCKFLYLVSFYGPAMSAWILMFVTVERALSVWIPHKINIACRPITAYIIIGLTSVVLLLIYLPFMSGVDVVTKYYHVDYVQWKECTALSYSFLYKNLLIWMWLDLFLSALLPFLAIATCNLAILIRICMLQQKRRQNERARGVRQAGNKKNGKSMSSRVLSTVTVRIVALSVTFFICTAPICVLNLLLLEPGFTRAVGAEHVEKLRLPFTILMYLNNAMNFVLYCAIGTGFRKDLVGIFRPGSRSSIS